MLIKSHFPIFFWERDATRSPLLQCVMMFLLILYAYNLYFDDSLANSLVINKLRGA